MSTLKDDLLDPSEKDMENPRAGAAGSSAKGKRGNLAQRWIALACCILFVEFAAGAAYAFGVYSATLAQVFKWTDADLASVSSLSDIGLYISLPGGFVYDRFGPMVTLIVGAVFTAAGYVLIYLTTIGTIEGTVTAVTIFFFISYQGASWLDTAGVATSLRNFAKNGALIVGLIKSFFGLSGSIVSQVYLTFFIATQSSNSSNADAPECFINGSLVDPATGDSNATTASAAFLVYSAPSEHGAFLEDAAPLDADASTAMPVFLFLAIASAGGALISSIFTRLVRVPSPDNAGDSDSDGDGDSGSGSSDGEIPALTKPEIKKIYIGYGLVTALALAMAGTVSSVRTWAVSTVTSQHTYVYLIFALVSGLLMALFLVVGVSCSRGAPSPLEPRTRRSQNSKYHKVVTEEQQGGVGGGDESALSDVAQDAPAQQQDTALEAAGGGDGGNGLSAASMAERTLLKSLACPEYWLLWFVHFFGTGAGLMVINQVAQMALAYGDNKSSSTIFVTIVGVRLPCRCCAVPVLCRCCAVAAPCRAVAVAVLPTRTRRQCCCSSINSLSLFLFCCIVSLSLCLRPCLCPDCQCSWAYDRGYLEPQVQAPSAAANLVCGCVPPHGGRMRHAGHPVVHRALLRLRHLRYCVRHVLDFEPDARRRDFWPQAPRLQLRFPQVRCSCAVWRAPP